MGALKHDEYCDRVAAEIDRLAAAAATAEPNATVATCGRWRTRTLFHHIGQIHDWVTRIVATRSTARLSRTAAGYPIPADPARWPEWLATGGAALLDALRGTDPDTAVWTWGPDKHVRWWARRMLHETGVHRVDAELAQGLDPVLDADMAADGVDEFLTNLPSAAKWAWDVRKLRGDGEVLALVATDRPTAWHLTLEPTRFSWQRTPAGSAPVAATVTASTTDLYLFVWGRRRVGDPHLAADGDGKLIDFWTAHSAI